MTTAKSMSAKLAVGFVAVAMLFSFTVPAQAQSSVEAQIQALLAQIAQLQAQLGGGGSAGAGVCPFTWTRDLNVGASGEDVRKLQQFLNSDAETRVAASGAGSAGQETMTYGPLTGAAVAKFQTKYRADILTPLGLVNPTTYFGASSRAKANSLCSTESPTTPTPGGPLTGGEGTLRNPLDLGDVETEVKVGQTERVLGVEMEARDSDIRLERVDVEFTVPNVGGSSIRLDRYVDQVSLYLDGTRIGQMSAGNSTREGRVHTLRFTGLNGVIRNGQTGELYVHVRALSTIGDSEEGEMVEVRIPEWGIRAVDGSGLSETYFSSDFEGDFSVVESDDAELTMTESDENPLARVEKVSKTTTTSGITLLEFDLEAEGGDVKIIDLPVEIVADSEDVEDVVQSVSLRRGSQTLQTRSLTNNDTGAQIVVFRNLNVTIYEDDTETFSVVATVKRQDVTTYDSGESIWANATTGDIVAEDADGETVAPTGEAEGNEVTLMSEGISATLVSTSATKSSNAVTGQDTGTFTLVFDVTAFGKNAFLSATSVDDIADWDYDGAYDDYNGGTISSTATRVGDAYRVNDGQTRRFTVQYVFTGDDSFMNVYFDAINFGDDQVHTDETWIPVDANVFKTNSLYLISD